MSEALLETVLGGRRARKVKCIVVDLDVTDDPTHGAQHAERRARSSRDGA